MAALQANPSPQTRTLFSSLLGSRLQPARDALAAGGDATASFDTAVPLMWPSYHARSARARCSMLEAAGVGGCAAAVPLLVEAGARVGLRDIKRTIEVGSTDALAALLAAEKPRAPAGYDIGLAWAERWAADPLWQVMLYACDHGLRRSGRMLELLLAAGYRPVTFTGARMTDDGDSIYFLEEDFCPAKVWGLGAEPRKYNSVGWFKLPSNGQLKPLWDLISAGPLAPWTPERHRWMPPAFKAAARTLLLAVHRSGGASGGASGGGARTAALGALPPPVLLHVLSLAAFPASDWLPVGV